MIESVNIIILNLIQKILNGDPKMRPNLDEILAHDFLNHGG